MNFLKNQFDATPYQSHHASPRRRRDSILNVTNNTALTRLLKKFVINFSGELIQILCVVKLGELNSTFGIKHIRLLLDESYQPIDSHRDSSFLLYGRHWQLEFLIESFWWSFKEWNHDSTENITSIMHMWRTPVYLGMGFIKIGTLEQDLRNFVKVAVLFDVLQLEWSSELSHYILLAIKYIDKSFLIRF